MIDIALLQASLPYLIRGSGYTIAIAASACIIGCILGTLFGIALSSKNYLVWLGASIYTTIFRGTPLLIQIIFATLVLPSLGLPISRLGGVIWAIGLNSSAYIAHIIKSGISSISRGQWEAGKTLGFTNSQIIRYIILPQAIRVVLPALGNEFITLIKESSLASIVGIQELTKEGEIIASRTFDALTIYLGVALCYLVITTILTALVTYIEQRMRVHAQH